MVGQQYEYGVVRGETLDEMVTLLTEMGKAGWRFVHYTAPDRPSREVELGQGAYDSDHRAIIERPIK